MAVSSGVCQQLDAITTDAARSKLQAPNSSKQQQQQQQSRNQAKSRGQGSTAYRATRVCIQRRNLEDSDGCQALSFSSFPGACLPTGTGGGRGRW
ncbi:hypothetical protein CRUP_018388 [Coryphaenoides rupestris]|nr:hypothetical protein CRUP_018388 [Coryphaenoides rupestris]